MALLLAGIFGLVAAIMLPAPPLKKKVTRTMVAPIPPHHAPDGGTALATAGTPPAPSTDELVKFCSQHVSEDRSFVLFRRGTCVVVTEPCADPLAEARKKLARCADIDARFVPEPTIEGDLIVSFKEPVFQRFTRTELVELGPWLDQVAPALLSPAESMSAGERWAPHENAKVGLLARRRMLEDASNAVPVKIIRAKSRATAAR